MLQKRRVLGRHPLKYMSTSESFFTYTDVTRLAEFSEVKVLPSRGYCMLAKAKRYGRWWLQITPQPFQRRRRQSLARTLLTNAGSVPRSHAPLAARDPLCGTEKDLQFCRRRTIFAAKTKKTAHKWHNFQNYFLSLYRRLVTGDDIEES